MIEVICVTYGQNWSLKCLINSFKSQTSQDWFLRIIHDGECKQFDILKDDLCKNDYLSDQVYLESTKERFNDFGHSLRSHGLLNPIKDSDFILITNGDNYYLPSLIENIQDTSILNPDAQFIFFDYIQKFDHKIHNIPKDRFFCMHNKIQEGIIDMGSAAVSTKIARSTGFNYTSYNGDFLYFKDCLSDMSQENIHKIPQPLFVHI